MDAAQPLIRRGTEDPDVILRWVHLDLNCHRTRMTARRLCEDARRARAIAATNRRRSYLLQLRSASLSTAGFRARTAAPACVRAA